jgi:hypothetical protein
LVYVDCRDIVLKFSDTLLEYVYCFVENLDSNAVLGLDLTGSVSDSS